MSGAGRSFALKTLEDMGYETVDNLPLSLLKLMVTPGHTLSSPLAVGIDTRTRDFSVYSFLEHINLLQKRADLQLDIVFCDCDDEVLAQRYTETRRRHPLAGERPAVDGIRAERQLLALIRPVATFILDTTSLSVADTRHILRHRFNIQGEGRLFIQIVSFSLRFGIPREADAVFDVRFLQNPHYDPNLKSLTGRDQPVAAFIQKDPLLAPFLKHTRGLLELMLPRFDEDARSYFTVAFGCTGGQHRSVFVAEEIYRWLMHGNRLVGLRHRELGNSTDITKGKTICP